MNNADTYKTILAPSEGLFKDRGSKFLSFAFPVDTEEEVKLIIAEIRKKFHDAKHYCYAYKLGTNNFSYRMNDDGEPSGTGGRPIYGQILSFGLTNILILVVRYFGGKLLGTGGLINAYKSASADALRNARLEEKILQDVITLDFNYKDVNDVNRILKSYNCDIDNQIFDVSCHYQIKVRKAFSKGLQDKLAFLNDIKVVLK